MKSIKITGHAIVNIDGHGEKFQGDIVRDISDELAAHLVNDCRVAEYLDSQPSERAGNEAGPVDVSEESKESDESGQTDPE